MKRPGYRPAMFRYPFSNSAPWLPLRLTMTRRLMRSMSATSCAASAADMSRSWWLWTSMNGYFARAGLCSGTTSVDFGSYSSIDIVCPAAGLGRAAAAAARRNAAGTSRRLTPRTARLRLQDRVDLAAVVDVVSREEPDDARDGQPAEVRMLSGARELLRREGREELDVRPPERREEREALGRVPPLVAAHARPDVLVHPDELGIVALEHRPDPVPPEQLDLRKVRQDLTGRPLARRRRRGQRPARRARHAAREAPRRLPEDPHGIPPLHVAFDPADVFLEGLRHRFTPSASALYEFRTSKSLYFQHVGRRPGCTSRFFWAEAGIPGPNRSLFRI